MNTIAALIMGAAAAALVTDVARACHNSVAEKAPFRADYFEIPSEVAREKQGTPTMGGLMFIFGTIAAVAVTVITDKLLGGDIVDSSATGASIIELYTKFYSGIIFALSVALIGFADDYIKVVKKAQPRSDREAEDDTSVARYNRLSRLTLYGHGQGALYVHSVCRQCSYGRILLDLRLCRYLCRDKCSQLHRRHRRTLFERYDNLRTFHVRYCLYA